MVDKYYARVRTHLLVSFNGASRLDVPNTSELDRSNTKWLTSRRQFNTKDPKCNEIDASEYLLVQSQVLLGGNWFDPVEENYATHFRSTTLGILRMCFNNGWLVDIFWIQRVSSVFWNLVVIGDCYNFLHMSVPINDSDFDKKILQLFETKRCINWFTGSITLKKAFTQSLDLNSAYFSGSIFICGHFIFWNRLSKRMVVQNKSTERSLDLRC